MVNNWKFPNAAKGQYNSDPKFPFTDFVGAAQQLPMNWEGDRLLVQPRFLQVNPGLQNPKWVGYDWQKATANPEVPDQPGVPGQNTSDPLSTFNNHCLVLVGDTYYDPSYGVTYSSLQDVQNKAIAGFYKVDDVTDPRDKTKVVRAMLIKKPDSLDITTDPTQRAPGD